MFATTSYRVLGCLSKLELSSACSNVIRGKVLKVGKSSSFTERLLSSAAAATESYNYILVGGGTASCVLAKRLLETNPDYKILVLEAGSPDFNHKHIKVPAAVGQLFKSDKDWDLTSSSESEPGLSAGHGGVYLCRGKVLGGSSCTNVLLYNRGSARDFDKWQVPGWSSTNVLDYFKKSENNHAVSDPKFHGNEGPMDIDPVQYTNPLISAFFEASRSAGYSRNNDFNNWDKGQTGVGPFHVAQHNGVRSSAASAYLSTVLDDPQLEVVTGAQVSKLDIAKSSKTGEGVATGVTYRKDGRSLSATIEEGGEVILAAGAVGSPHLLMLSGIGPKKHLEEHGIECIADLPVGQNLQDHPAAVVAYAIDKKVSVTDEFKFMGMSNIPNPVPFIKYLLSGKGVMTSVGCDHGGFFKTSEAKEDPDLQIRFIGGLAQSPHGISNYDEYAAKWLSWPSGYTMQNIAVRPQSKGSIRLKSSNYHDKPVISTGYLTSPEDVVTIREGIKLSRELGTSKEFHQYNPVEMFPGPAIQTDEEIDEYIRSSAHSGNALVGSCKMGADPKSTVVDPELRVNGIESLRVIDSSIMPMIPGGQTCASTLMIAEKGADLLLDHA
jgi:choline dehydrogenase-like flavoprotein